MENLKILILIGIPASGKTTWANKYIHNNPSWVRVSRDSFRYMLKDVKSCEPNIEKMITDMVNDTIRRCLSKRLNVIVDATHLKLNKIEMLVEEFKYDADIDYKVFDISLNKAIERDANRSNSVGKDLITTLYEEYKDLIETFNYKPIKKQKRPYILPKFDTELPNAVCFDIDGTIALMDKRHQFDWDKVDNDIPNNIVIEQIKFHKREGRTIILLSGRDEVCRKLTEEWLEVYDIPYDYLYMRKKDDFRKDNIIKNELYYEHIANRYNLLCVYDDRLQVLDMWNKLGIFTYNVNQGNILF